MNAENFLQEILDHLSGPFDRNYFLALNTASGIIDLGLRVCEYRL
jgi:hypothetical protein